MYENVKNNRPDKTHNPLKIAKRNDIKLGNLIIGFDSEGMFTVNFPPHFFFESDSFFGDTILQICGKTVFSVAEREDLKIFPSEEEVHL